MVYAYGISIKIQYAYQVSFLLKYENNMEKTTIDGLTYYVRALHTFVDASVVVRVPPLTDCTGCHVKVPYMKQKYEMIILFRLLNNHTAEFNQFPRAKQL